MVDWKDVDKNLTKKYSKDGIYIYYKTFLIEGFSFLAEDYARTDSERFWNSLKKKIKDINEEVYFAGTEMDFYLKKIKNYINKLK